MVTISKILLLLFSFSVNAAINLHIDRNEVSLNESFNLIFESDDSVDDDPDFSPLSVYFDILSTSHSSNISIINNNYSKKKIWKLTLMPKQAGKITIPAISFGKDKSQPAVITINKQPNFSTKTKDRDIFIQANTDDDNVVVGQQVLLTVKIFTRLNISGSRLSRPETDGFKSKYQQHGETNQYRTRIGQKTYNVFQQQYLLTPENAGVGTILPITLQTEVGRRSSLISPFGQSQIIKTQTEAIPLEVKNKSSKDDELWLPAEEVVISSKIDKGPYKLGEPINLTITMRAKKQFAELLPLLPIPKQSSYKSYTDKPIFSNTKTDQGVNGELVQKYAIIPQQVGDIKIPAYSVKWWNTKTDQFETADIASKVLTIEALGTPEKKKLDHVKKEESTKNLEPMTVKEVPDSNIIYWRILSVILFILWIGTLINYKRYLNGNKKIKPPAQNSVVKKSLIDACKKSNPKEVQKYLIKWASINFSTNITNIQKIKSYVSNDFSFEIDALQYALYSDKKGDWNGLKLLNMVKQYQVANKQKKDDTFRTLYPK